MRLNGVLSRGSLDMWALKNCGSKFKFVYSGANLCAYGRIGEGKLTAASPMLGVAFCWSRVIGRRQHRSEHCSIWRPPSFLTCSEPSENQLAPVSLPCVTASRGLARAAHSKSQPLSRVA